MKERDRINFSCLCFWINYSTGTHLIPFILSPVLPLRIPPLRIHSIFVVSSPENVPALPTLIQVDFTTTGQSCLLNADSKIRILCCK